MRLTSKTQANYERLANIYKPNRPEPKPGNEMTRSEREKRTSKQIINDIINGKAKKSATASSNNKLFKKQSGEGYVKKSQLKLRPS